MSSILPLSIAALILAFMIGILSSFPIQGSTAIPAQASTISEDTFSVEAAQEVGNRFSSVYTSVVDDLLSYQKNPDYQRAENQRQALVSYSESLVTQFQEFAARLRAKLDELTAMAPETTTEEPVTP